MNRLTTCSRVIACWLGLPPEVPTAKVPLVWSAAVLGSSVKKRLGDWPHWAEKTPSLLMPKVPPAAMANVAPAEAPREKEFSSPSYMVQLPVRSSAMPAPVVASWICQPPAVSQTKGERVRLNAKLFFVGSWLATAFGKESIALFRRPTMTQPLRSSPLGMSTSTSSPWTKGCHSLSPLPAT
jgi:hypothetical protein